MCVCLCVHTHISLRLPILLPSLQEVTSRYVCNSRSVPYVMVHSSNLSTCKTEFADYHLRASLPIESKKTRLSYTVRLVFKAHFYLLQVCH